MLCIYPSPNQTLTLDWYWYTTVGLEEEKLRGHTATDIDPKDFNYRAAERIWNLSLCDCITQSSSITTVSYNNTDENLLT